MAKYQGQTSYLTRFSYSGLIHVPAQTPGNDLLSMKWSMQAIERRVVPREGAGLQNEFTFWGEGFLSTLTALFQ